MSLTLPTNYSAKLLTTRQPRFIVRFADDATVQFSTGTIQASTRTTYNYLTIPSGIGQGVDLKKMQSQVSSVSFGILDKSSLITELIYTLNTADTPVLNQTVTVMCGFADLDETDFVSWTGQVDSYEYDSKMWKFTARDLQRTLKQKIYKCATTTLAEDLTSGEADITFTSGTEFSDGDYVRINDEVILLGGKSDDTFSTCTRAQYGTTATTHSSGDDITEFVVVTGHPMTILNTNIWQGQLGISSALINTTDLTDITDHWLPDWTMTFYFDSADGVDARKFVEEEIFRPTGTFQRVRPNGKLAVGMIRVPFPDEDTLTLDEDTVWDVSYGRLDRSMINSLTIFYDYDFVDKEYDTRIKFLDSDSITNHGVTNDIEMKLKGLHGSVTEQITRISTRIFQWFATATPRLKMSVSMRKWHYEIGDVVQFTHSKVPDILTGVLGMTSRSMTIIKQSVDFATGTVDVELADVGLTVGSGDYRRIGATTLQDYGSESAANQGKYGFIDRFEIAPG